MIIIFTYNRREMLEKMTEHLECFNPLVIDDGSNYKILHKNTVRFAHGGKQQYWKRWDFALRECKISKDDFFMFTPDDYENIDMKKIMDIHRKFKHKPYVYNIVNDGRDSSWNKITPIEIDEETLKVGFTDCGFFCNRKALEKLNFEINPISQKRFELDPFCGSGVGHQLTFRFNRAGVGIYKPKKSLAFHGDHESVMHPELRKKQPLTSK